MLKVRSVGKFIGLVDRFVKQNNIRSNFFSFILKFMMGIYVPCFFVYYKKYNTKLIYEEVKI